MPLFSFEGHTPNVHATVWIAPTASVVGDVTIEEGASIWFGTVIRADFGPVVIRAGANVQDGSVIHSGLKATEVGPGATIGHLCIVHGAVIGAEALVGNGSTVLDGAVIGARSLIAAGSTVAPNTEIPADVLALGSPAKVRGSLSESAKAWVEHNPGVYRELAQRYAATSHQVD